jgi:aminocarboxymuconate-semialdehyde decarboxylase
LVHDVDALELLLKKMGEDRVVLGSDYPFILGEHRPGELVLAATAVPDRVKRKILVDNALKLFGLTRAQFE